MTTRVYLAGPITGCSYKGCTEWREVAAIELRDNFDIHGMSPMRGKHYLENEAKILHHYQGIKDKFGASLSSPVGISTRDVNDVHRCDGVLVNFLGADAVSQGTVFEMGMAKAFNKPVVIVMDEDNVHVHAFTNEGFIITDDLEVGVQLIGALLSDRL